MPKRFAFLPLLVLVGCGVPIETRLLEFASAAYHPVLVQAALSAVGSPSVRDSFQSVVVAYAWQRTHVAPDVRYRCASSALYAVPPEGDVFSCEEGGAFSCRPGDCLLEEVDPDDSENSGPAVRVKKDRKRELLQGALYRWRKKGRTS